MQTFQCSCEKASFSDFAQYAYTCTDGWSETFWYPEVCNSLLVNSVKKLSKSVNICKSYCTKFTGTFLWTTVYNSYKLLKLWAFILLKQLVCQLLVQLCYFLTDMLSGNFLYCNMTVSASLSATGVIQGLLSALTLCSQVSLATIMWLKADNFQLTGYIRHL